MFVLIDNLRHSPDQFDLFRRKRRARPETAKLRLRGKLFASVQSFPGKRTPNASKWVGERLEDEFSLQWAILRFFVGRWHKSSVEEVLIHVCFNQE